jgi:hypothetical protein
MPILGAVAFIVLLTLAIYGTQNVKAMAGRIGAEADWFGRAPALTMFALALGNFVFMGIPFLSLLFAIKPELNSPKKDRDKVRQRALDLLKRARTIWLVASGVNLLAAIAVLSRT